MHLARISGTVAPPLVKGSIPPSSVGVVALRLPLAGWSKDTWGAPASNWTVTTLAASGVKVRVAAV